MLVSFSIHQGTGSSTPCGYQLQRCLSLISDGMGSQPSVSADSEPMDREDDCSDLKVVQNLLMNNKLIASPITVSLASL